MVVHRSSEGARSQKRGYVRETGRGLQKLSLKSAIVFLLTGTIDSPAEMSAGARSAGAVAAALHRREFTRWSSVDRSILPPLDRL